MQRRLKRFGGNSGNAWYAHIVFDVALTATGLAAVVLTDGFRADLTAVVFAAAVLVAVAFTLVFAMVVFAADFTVVFAVVLAAAGVAVRRGFGAISSSVPDSSSVAALRVRAAVRGAAFAVVFFAPFLPAFASKVQAKSCPSCSAPSATSGIPAAMRVMVLGESGRLRPKIDCDGSVVSMYFDAGSHTGSPLRP